MLIKGSMLFAASLTLVACAPPQEQSAQQIYQQNCAGCHGDEGGGGVGPALAGNRALEDAAQTTNRIVNGGGGMPAYGGRLSEEQISAVVTYIRTSWGNDYGQAQ